MRRTFIAGNWKMHNTPEESAALAGELVEGLKKVGHRLLIAPSFTSLTTVAEILKGTNILLGAQNMAPIEKGAQTGETSVTMLKAIGVEAVILGHSERRHVYGETDSLINEKVKLALAKGLEVILCLGELLEEREAGRAEEVVDAQAREGLRGVSPAELAGVTLAYEPVWAIGTGKTATPKDADDIHRVIRETIGELYSKRAAEEIIIQYGGSVKPENIRDLMRMENIDGALVGGASLKGSTFIPIADYDR